MARAAHDYSCGATPPHRDAAIERVAARLIEQRRLRTGVLMQLEQALSDVRAVNEDLEKILNDRALQRNPPTMPLHAWPSREHIAHLVEQLRSVSTAVAHWEKRLREYGIG